ncbi:helix-turn-helix domain-containing protein [Nocardioides zeae]|uniref:Helix-turn-helix transcriptional regulator n=1 Tax=Nocardioides zeae TaxID=1457234 RepID=A0A6P0HPN9_9ACTN|nr:XRE family transcriptional regulator [Nocardioides zeae]NEN80662.1 helix-turn-helix transcriptional regulator [Nocardioides zeae]
MDEPRDPTAAAVGARVRALRSERGLTLSALARTAGIGKASLSELEQGRRNPTLATLYAVAGPLGVPLVALLGDAPGAVVADPGDPEGPGDPGLVARLLHVDRDPGTTTEVYWIELPPGGRRDSVPHTAGAVEHVLVVRGSLVVTVDGVPTSLGPGDAHAWRADVPHGYAAGPDGAAGVDTIRTGPG